MASFLLVHGSWHGAWCWERLVPLLRDAGHEVRCCDLPAHGDDPSSAWLATLPSYGVRVADAASGCSENPLAVGHSMGGFAITQAAASRPEAFAGLVYLCAFAPLPGDSLARLGRQDPESRLPSSIAPGLAGVRIRPGAARAVFYSSCSESDATWAGERLRPDPLIPMFQRLRRGAPEGLPRAYVECTEDRAISIRRQRAMADRAGIERRVVLETDHSPFLSAPAELAGGLSELAGLMP